MFVADRVYEFLKIFDNALAILAQQNGMNRWLARALAAGFFVPVAWGAKHSFFGVWKRGLRPKIVTGAYTAVYCLGMYAVSRNVYFARETGRALKWYAETPEGIRFYDDSGYDTKYGIKLKPATPDMMIDVERRARGQVPRLVPPAQLPSLDLFDAISGDPKYWYYRLPDGSYDLFDGPGFDPRNGQPLQHIDSAVANEIRNWLQGGLRAVAEAEHLAFIDKYVDRSIGRAVGLRQWAVLVTDSQGVTVPGLVEAATEGLSGKGIRVVSLFRPQLLRDRLNEQLYSAEPSLIRKLSLAQLSDGVVIGKASFAISNSDAAQGLTTARVSLHVRLISTANASVADEFEVNSQGAGFSIDAARAQAIERTATALKSRLTEALR